MCEIVKETSLLSRLSLINSKVCIFLIVRNEGHIIERCLDSTLPVADAVCITDTGSTDDTVEKIESWLVRNNVPGKVCSSEFISFSHARTASFNNVVTFLQDREEDLNHWYGFSIDADHTVKTTFKDKNELFFHRAAGYAIRMTDGNTEYPLERIFSLRYKWHCVRRAHEVWEVIPGPNDNIKQGDAIINPIIRAFPINGIYVWDVNDGGNHADKYEREYKLLMQDLEEMPNDARTNFYLGRTCYFTGKYKESIKFHKTVVANTHWSEEKYYSLYEIGMCYHKLEDDRQLIYFQQAHVTNPRRPEAVYYLNKYYNNKKLFAMVRTLPPVTNLIKDYDPTILFLDKNLYNLALFERHISSYYLSNIEEGRVLGEQLLLHKDVHSAYTNTVNTNMLFYLKPLLTFVDGYHIHNLSNQIKHLTPSKFHSFNPSICTYEDGFLVNVRFSNYELIDGRYEIDGGGAIITRNWLLKLTNDYKIIWNKELIAAPPTHPKQLTVGMEDVRIAIAGGKLHLTWTSQDYHPISGPQISYTNFPLESVEKEYVLQIVNPKPLDSPESAPNEKNWIPFVKDDTLTYIYKYGPYTLLNEQFEIISKTELNANLSSLRGSSSVVDIGGGQRLSVVHNMIWKENKRYYLHRFVLFDNDKPIKVSHMWYINMLGIEYVSGMAFKDNKLHITCSINDGMALILQLNLASVLKYIAANSISC